MNDKSRRLNPCFWMRVLLNGMAEGHSTGLLGWYARRHVDGCPKCREALDALKAMRSRLLGMGDESATVSQDVWDQLESTPVIIEN